MTGFKQVSMQRVWQRTPDDSLRRNRTSELDISMEKYLAITHNPLCRLLVIPGPIEIADDVGFLTLSYRPDN